jgi:Fur family transcriptional regulator, peroxide stress response regulator
MPSSNTRFEELIASLKERGFRLTPQRIELVRLIAASKEHPNAIQLHEKIKKQFPTMSLATVYKTVSLLKEMGQVMEIDLRDDSHYDGSRPQPHSHLICMKCNQIVDGDMDIEDAQIKRLEKESGFQIIRPQIAFYGICPHCRSQG